MNRLRKLLKLILPITLGLTSIQANQEGNKILKNSIDLIPFALNINNIKSEKGGQIIVFIFLENGFPKIHEKAFLKYTYPINLNQMTVKISIPKKTDFAIKILHDENKDGKVTKNWTGIFPKDGLGFSNGAKLSFGPPSFKEAKVNNQNTFNLNIAIIY